MVDAGVGWLVAASSGAGKGISHRTFTRSPVSYLTFIFLIPLLRITTRITSYTKNRSRREAQRFSGWWFRENSSSGIRVLFEFGELVVEKWIKF